MSKRKYDAELYVRIRSETVHYMVPVGQLNAAQEKVLRDILMKQMVELIKVQTVGRRVRAVRRGVEFYGA